MQNVRARRNSLTGGERSNTLATLWLGFEAARLFPPKLPTLLREVGDDYSEIGAFALHFDLAATPSSVTIRGMAAAAFDTFQAARALESAGVERAQAEAIAEAIQQRQNYATKSDVAKLGSELRAEMAALETRLTNRFYAVAVGLAATVAAFGLFT